MAVFRSSRSSPALPLLAALLRPLGVAAVFAAGLVVSLSAAADDSRPNVILIMTDDQGYGDFSRHGNPVLQTPVMDALAEESIRFSDFHVSPTCTPTRGQLMSGPPRR